jgi:DNA-binding XRE family transcriptional regulator
MRLGGNLAKALKKFRYDRRERTQAWLAKELGVTRATIIRWEKKDAGTASLNQVEDIANRLGIPIAELLGISVPAPRTIDARSEGTSPVPAGRELEHYQAMAEVSSILPTLNHVELLKLRAYARALPRARAASGNQADQG